MSEVHKLVYHMLNEIVNLTFAEKVNGFFLESYSYFSHSSNINVMKTF